MPGAAGLDAGGRAELLPVCPVDRPGQDMFLDLSLCGWLCRTDQPLDVGATGNGLPQLLLVSAPAAFFPSRDFELSLDGGGWLGLEISRRDVGITGAHAGSFVWIRPFAGWMGSGNFLCGDGGPDAGLV